MVCLARQMSTSGVWHKRSVRRPSAHVFIRRRMAKAAEQLLLCHGSGSLAIFENRLMTRPAESHGIQCSLHASYDSKDGWPSLLRAKKPAEGQESPCLLQLRTSEQTDDQAR